MAEPTAPVVASAFLGVAGFIAPQYRELAFIAAGAIAGSAFYLSSQPKMGLLENLKHISISTGIALFLSGLLSWLGQKYFEIPQGVSGGAIACIIGARTDWVMAKITGKVDKTLGAEK